MTNNPNPSRPFGYNQTSARYVDPNTGRFISLATAQQYADQAAESGLLNARDFYIGAAAQGTPAAIVQRTLMYDLKINLLSNYTAGRGGIFAMTPADYGRAGARIKQVYQKLQGSFNELMRGEISQAEFLKRLDRYYHSAMGAYEAGRYSANKAAGKTQKRRVLGVTDNHCPPCVEYASISRNWVDIDDGSVPLPTEQCDCGGNCLCGMEYR